MRFVALNSQGYYAWTREVTKVCSRESPNFPVLGGDAKGGDAENLNMPNYGGPKTDRFERRVKAGEPFAFTVSTLRRVDAVDVMLVGSTAGQDVVRKQAWACNIRVEFVPAAGANYEIEYDFAPGKCDLAVNELAGAGVTAKKPIEVSKSPATCALALPS